MRRQSRQVVAGRDSRQLPPGSISNLAFWQGTRLNFWREIDKIGSPRSIREAKNSISQPLACDVCSGARNGCTISQA